MSSHRPRLPPVLLLSLAIGLAALPGVRAGVVWIPAMKFEGLVGHLLEEAGVPGAVEAHEVLREGRYYRDLYRWIAKYPGPLPPEAEFVKVVKGIAAREHGASVRQALLTLEELGLLTLIDDAARTSAGPRHLDAAAVRKNLESWALVVHQRQVVGAVPPPRREGKRLVYEGRGARVVGVEQYGGRNHVRVHLEASWEWRTEAGEPTDAPEPGRISGSILFPIAVWEAARLEPTGSD